MLLTDYHPSHRADIRAGQASLPALVAYTKGTAGDKLAAYRFFGNSTRAEISKFLDTLMPFHGVTIPGPKYNTIQSFLRNKLTMPKMLILTEVISSLEP